MRTLAARAIGAALVRCGAGSHNTCLRLAMLTSVGVGEPRLDRAGGASPWPTPRSARHAPSLSRRRTLMRTDAEMLVSVDGSCLRLSSLPLGASARFSACRVPSPS